jgi:hypothetical protein
MTRNETPPSLEWIIDQARRPRSQREIEAGRLLLLGRITIGEFLAVLHEEKQAR